MNLKNIGVHIAEEFTNFIGSWYFIVLYTSSFGLYIGFHAKGIVHFDNDYTKFNLFLAAFTVTQGSMLLIASNKQNTLDRDKWNHDHADANQKILELTEQMDKIEESIEQLLEVNSSDEENEKLP